MSRRREPTGNAVETLLLPTADAEWLAPVLDADSLRRALAQVSAPLAKLKVTHVRYRPGASCTVAYDAQCPGGDEAVPLYARTVAPGRDLPLCPGPGTGPTPAGHILGHPTPLDEGRIVVRQFPQDATLPELQIVTHPDNLAQLVAQVASGGRAVTGVAGSFTRLRYKAEHRLILRADLKWQDVATGNEHDYTCQLRFEYGVDRKARRLTREALATELPADGPVQVPGAEVDVPDVGCAMVAWRSGRDTSRDLARGRPAAADHAARALASLAKLSVDAFAHLPHRPAGRILDGLAAQVRILRDHPPAPGVADRLDRILGCLAGICPADRSALVHGDFHQGQVLTDGDRVHLLDWDRAHRGDNACDQGRFLAQIHLLDVRGRKGAKDLATAFRSGLAAAGAPAVEATRERFWTVAALAELALREMRRLRPDWLARTSALFDRCDTLLQGQVAP